MDEPKVHACEHCRKEITSDRGPAYAAARKFCSPKCQYAASRARFVERFWMKVDKRRDDECWPWIAGTDRAGYGKLGAGGTTLIASRVSYELAHGEIPTGMYVLHRCDNPPCVNPSHLFIGTHLDNVRDMDAKGRRVLGGFAKPLHARQLHSPHEV